MGKLKNVSIMALARNMATYAWLILMGHPSPLKVIPKAFKTKMLKLAPILVRDRVRQAGFKNASAFVDTLTEKVYGLPLSSWYGATNSISRRGLIPPPRRNCS